MQGWFRGLPGPLRHILCFCYTALRSNLSIPVIRVHTQSGSMKRIATLLLLVILLFNWFGYRLLISLMEEKANTQLEAQLDGNTYDESQLISVKIPVRYISYYNNSTTFERVDGQIEIDGIQYKYVKRRLYNDSLEMLCIPNHAAMKWNAAKNEFFRFSNDLQQEKKPGSHPGPVKSFLTDVYTILDPFNVGSLPLQRLQTLSHYSAGIASCYSPTAEQPPDIR
jgi:hypothetical protein